MDSSEQRFAMRWSRLTWVVTIGVCSAVALLPVVVLHTRSLVPAGDTLSWILLIVGPLVPVILFGVVALFGPLAFKVRPDAIVVKRIGWDVVIPRGEIREIRRMEPGEARFAWRLCGSGGFLGFFGLFYSRALGDFWAYAGNREDLVLITRADGTKIVISPSPPDAFLKAVQQTGM